MFASVKKVTLFSSGKLDKSLALLKKAAMDGVAEAEFKLGECHENGFGLQKDSVAAMEWYGKAGMHGHERALACHEKKLGKLTAVQMMSAFYSAYLI